MRLALGTDSSNSGGRHSLFEIMRLALMLSRPETSDPRAWPAASRVFEMATTGGARALGLTGELGSIEPGRRADLVLLDPRTAALAGAPVTVPHLVQHASAESVTAVMVNGAWALRDGRILTFDERAVIARVLDVTTELLARARADVELAAAAAPYFLAGNTPGV